MTLEFIRSEFAGRKVSLEPAVSFSPYAGASFDKAGRNLEVGAGNALRHRHKITIHGLVRYASAHFLAFGIG